MLLKILNKKEFIVASSIDIGKMKKYSLSDLENRSI